MYGHVYGHVDDGAPRDRGGRGYGEVVDFEDHRDGTRQLDALSVREAERLVVVEHRVHVLDPHGIDPPSPFIYFQHISEHADGERRGPVSM